MRGNKNQQLPNFLSGWKDIARYLGKGVRTVQRYERELRLPVRRPAGKSRASVVATKEELDAWVAASPFRAVFHLPQVPPDGAGFAKNITYGIQEMRRLRVQMAELREDVKGTVMLLRESIENVQYGMTRCLQNGKSRGIGHSDSRDKIALNLRETRVTGKAN